MGLTFTKESQEMLVHEIVMEKIRLGIGGQRVPGKGDGHKNGQPDGIEQGQTGFREFPQSWAAWQPFPTISP